MPRIIEAAVLVIITAINFMVSPDVKSPMSAKNTEVTVPASNKNPPVPSKY